VASRLRLFHFHFTWHARVILGWDVQVTTKSFWALHNQQEPGSTTKSLVDVANHLDASLAGSGLILACGSQTCEAFAPLLTSRGCPVAQFHSVSTACDCASATVAHPLRYGILVSVDSTMMPPVICKPLTLGHGPSDVAAAFSSLPVLASGFLKLILLFRQISQNLPTLGSQSQSARCGHRGAFSHQVLLWPC